MKMMMTENVNSSMPKTNNEKEFMLKIKGHSHQDITDKSIVYNLMNESTTKKFCWLQLIHDYVTSMVNLAAKLRLMGMEVSDSFLVQFIINSLILEFDKFQVI